MSDAIDSNKAAVRRHLEEGVSGKHPHVWDELMTDDFVIHHALVEPGRAGYAAAVGALWEGFPDLAVEILDLVAEDDKVVVRYIERGTHTGTFLGVPATGKSYEKHGFALYRLVDGRLAEAWFQEDDLGFQQQLFG